MNSIERISVPPREGMEGNKSNKKKCTYGYPVLPMPPTAQIKDHVFHPQPLPCSLSLSLTPFFLHQTKTAPRELLGLTLLGFAKLHLHLQTA